MPVLVWNYFGCALNHLPGAPGLFRNILIHGDGLVTCRCFVLNSHLDSLLDHDLGFSPHRRLKVFGFFRVSNRASS